MSYKIKEINLHITDFCDGHCPMCYATEEVMTRHHGDIKILKKIVHNAILNGKVERFVMVGGDPCEHPNLVELLKYIKEEGTKYNIPTKSMVISNTHNYKENGKTVKIEDIMQFIDGMCVTVHGPDDKTHDGFNRCEGSYEIVMNNLDRYAKLKNKFQEICIIINLMPQTVNCLKEIMLATNKRLNGKVDGFAIQRIAPIGRACGSTKYFIEPEDINRVLGVCKELKEQYGFYLEFVDAFPLCRVNSKYREMLPKGGCNWGTDYCAVFPDGSISRCAMSENKLSCNMTDLDTPEKFFNFWNKDEELVNFRNKNHLGEKCLRCNLLNECGGGCVLARKTGDPYKVKKIQKGYDYLTEIK